MSAVFLAARGASTDQDCLCAHPDAGQDAEAVPAMGEETDTPVATAMIWLLEWPGEPVRICSRCLTTLRSLWDRHEVGEHLSRSTVEAALDAMGTPDRFRSNLVTELTINPTPTRPSSGKESTDA